MTAEMGRPPVGPAIHTRLTEGLLEAVDAYADHHGVRRATAIRELLHHGLAATTATYTLVSALPGDLVPGVEASDPDCPISLVDHPEGAAWAEFHGWGEDLDELIYVLTPWQAAPAGFPTTHITVQLDNWTA